MYRLRRSRLRGLPFVFQGFCVAFVALLFFSLVFEPAHPKLNERALHDRGGG